MIADDLPARVRAALVGAEAIREVKMFGGIGFMLNNNMRVGASKRGLLVRVGRDNRQEALARPGSRPMEMRGRRMEGYVYVDPAALTDAAIKAWLKLALAFVRTLPPKTAGAPRASTKGKRK